MEKLRAVVRGAVIDDEDFVFTRPGQSKHNGRQIFFEKLFPIPIWDDDTRRGNRPAAINRAATTNRAATVRERLR